MRASLGVDPQQCNYGPATPAIRRALELWQSVDWFEPAASHAAPEALGAYAEHLRRARVHQPELFPEHVDVRVECGDWAKFHELSACVRALRGWDWKFSALKLLSRAHSEAHGWELKDEVASLPSLDPTAPGPADLFLRFGEVVAWRLEMGLQVPPSLGPREAEVARWYCDYARMDLLECIEWQLAEKSDRLDENPFYCLGECYAAGFYPFGLGPRRTVLFGFV